MADTIKEAAANEGHNVSHDKDHEETAGPNVEQTEQPGGAENIPGDVRDQIIATVYGQCMGDAIGLLSEFYDKEEAVEVCDCLYISFFVRLYRLLTFDYFNIFICKRDNKLTSKPHPLSTVYIIHVYYSCYSCNW